MRAALLATDVDRELGAGRGGRCRDVAHADALVEHRRVRARRDLATTGDWHALPRNRLLLHHERDELPLGPASLIARSSSTPLNSFPSAHVQPSPAEIASVSWRDVVAVQRVADLEPERVSRAEAAGDGAAGDDRVPELDRVLRRAHQLDAELACVAGPVDHHLDAVDLAHRVGERLRLGQPEPLDRLRALDGQERVLVGGVAHLGAADLALLQPRVRRRRGCPR